MSAAVSTLEDFLVREKLPASYRESIERWYQPLAETLATRAREKGAPLLVGINGAQGSGKSTLAKVLAIQLRQAGLKVANLSIDDFYLDRASRAQLAEKEHPLLATRGVPGTHDLKLAQSTLATLLDPHGSGMLSLPRFDKARDEPLPRAEWERVELPVDIVLLEGWFVGAAPQAESQLSEPVNDLEAGEDPDRRWRRFVNRRLADYQSLFETIDFLVMLKAPSFECVYEWRGLQERKLAAKRGKNGDRIMDSAKLARFIQHFERLTRHCLETLPSRADLVLELDAQHQITNGSS